MTDLEMTRLCAEAMGFAPCPPSGPSDIILFVEEQNHPMLPKTHVRYDPLHDDAQAMELVKKFPITIGRTGEGFYAEMRRISYSPFTDLNRAIVACVAQMRSIGGRKA